MSWANAMLNAWHAKFSFLLLLFLTVVTVLTKCNIGPCKIVIWLWSRSQGTMEIARGLELLEFVPPWRCACHLSSAFSPGTKLAPHSTLCITCCHKCPLFTVPWQASAYLAVCWIWTSPQPQRKQDVWNSQFLQLLTCMAKMDVQNSLLHGLLFIVLACLVKIPSMTWIGSVFDLVSRTIRVSVASHVESLIVATRNSWNKHPHFECMGVRVSVCVHACLVSQYSNHMS